jgi:hypothetical protein
MGSCGGGGKVERAAKDGSQRLGQASRREASTAVEVAAEAVC